MALRISFRLLLFLYTAAVLLPRAYCMWHSSCPAKFSNLGLKIYVTWGPLVCGPILSWGPDKI